MTTLISDFLCADAEVFPSVGTIRETRVGPPILVPVARIGDIGIGKSEIALGLWIVRRFVPEIDLLTVLLLYFLIHVGHVDRLFLVGRGWREKHEQIMALLRGGLRGGLCR